MAWLDGLYNLGARNRRFEVIKLKPQEDTVPVRPAINFSDGPLLTQWVGTLRTRTDTRQCLCRRGLCTQPDTVSHARGLRALALA